MSVASDWLFGSSKYLLRRCVAVRHHGSQLSGILRLPPDVRSRSRSARECRWPDHDVAGFDVPVQKASGVDFGQAVSERQDMLANLRLRKGGLALKHFRQRFAVDVFHHDVGGTELPETSRGR